MNHREPFRRKPTSAEKREIARIRQAFGDVGRERGRANEQRVLEACEALCARAFPPFLRNDPPPRLATRDEDKSGIDVVVHADVGQLYLQVKSSRTGMRRFRGTPHKHPIAVVLVSDDCDAVTVEQRARGALRRVREDVLSRRSQR